MSMLIGVAVGYELAQTARPKETEQTMAVDIRFLGHAAFELKSGDTTVLVDPFLTGNPKAAVEAAEVEPTTSCSPTATRTTTATPSTSPSAPARPSSRSTEIAGEIGEQGVENVFDPNLGGTVDVRLGLGQARPRLAHLDDAQGHGHARRPAC